MSSVRSTPSEMTVVGRRRKLSTHLQEIWAYRELLVSLVRKELKVRYKNSILGFVWSMVQPVFLLIIYAVVFSILGASFHNFPIWLLCGLIIWTFVTTCCTTAVQSITANAYLVSKVRFPRVILPLATVGAAAVHLALQLSAFAVVLAVARHGIAWSYLWLLIPATVTALMFCAAAGVFLAAFNVKARDTQHLLDLAILGWFWLTPIIYYTMRTAHWLVHRGLPAQLGLVNPVTSIVITFQRAIYGHTRADGVQLLPEAGQLWYLRNLLIVGAVSGLLFCVALNFFDRAEANFAEEL